MSTARFLVVVLLLSLAAFAQNQEASPSGGSPIPSLDGSLFVRPDPLPPTLLPLPLDSQRSLLTPKTAIAPLAQSPRRSEDSILRDEVKQLAEGEKQYLASHGLDVNSQLTVHVSPQGKVTLQAGELCYSIRSYLMARDSKDSDSTHLVGVSNCQPAHQYGLKTTDPNPQTLQR